MDFWPDPFLTTVIKYCDCRLGGTFPFNSFTTSSNRWIWKSNLYFNRLSKSIIPSLAYFRKASLYSRIMVRSSVIIGDRKSTRLNSSHQIISYAVFCLKKKKKKKELCSTM